MRCGGAGKRHEFYQPAKPESPKAVRALIPEAAVTPPERMRYQNLLSAVQNLDADDVMRHVAAGESIDKLYETSGPGKYGTLLHIFSIVEQMEQVNLLLRLGADPDARDDTGQTALHLAADRGDATLGAALLDKHANPNLKENQFGLTPLHMAAARGRTELVRMLVAAGGDRQAKDRNGATPLLMAVNNGNPTEAIMLAAPLDLQAALRRDIQEARAGRIVTPGENVTDDRLE